MERVVVAFGGNALLRRGQEDTFENAYASARLAAERVVDIAASGWEVVVTHGNGPQVGRILLQQEAARIVASAEGRSGGCGAKAMAKESAA